MHSIVRVLDNSDNKDNDYLEDGKDTDTYRHLYRYHNAHVSDHGNKNLLSALITLARFQ